MAASRAAARHAAPASSALAIASPADSLLLVRARSSSPPLRGPAPAIRGHGTHAGGEAAAARTRHGGERVQHLAD